MANASVKGVGDGLVREKKSDVEVGLSRVADAGDYGEGVDDAKNVCLNLKVVLGDVDGNDGVRSLRGI